MWILTVIPDFLVHLLLVVGILGTIASFILSIIPFIKKYQLALQIVSIMILAFSLYLEGGLALKKDYDLKIADMKVEMANAATEAAKQNADIIQKYADQQAANEGKSGTVTRYIEKQTVKIDSSCTLSPEAIIAHNAAATNTPIDEEPVTPNTDVKTADHNAAARGDK